MAENNAIFTISIYGQKFRMRAPADERERIECIAAAVDERIRSHKQQGATSDLRATIMAAYQIGSELDELASSMGLDSNAEEMLDRAHEQMDQLLARLDTRIDDIEEDNSENA